MRKGLHGCIGTTCTAGVLSIDWSGHVTHITASCLPHSPLFPGSSFKATNDGSCWRPTAGARFALCKWIANGSTVFSLVSLLFVQLDMILAGWNWTFRSTTYNVVCAKDFQELVLFVSWMARSDRLSTSDWAHANGSTTWVRNSI